MKRRDIMLVLERLELYVMAGLPVDRALEVMAQGSAKASQRSAIEKVRDSVRSGAALSQALAKIIRVSGTISGLIEQGESSGELVRVLGIARSLLEREDELKKKVLSAMAYPLVIGVFAALLTLGLMRGVMPQIVPLLKSLNVHLPLLTRIVMAVSDWLMVYGLYAAASAVFFIALAVLVYKRSVFIRRLIQSAFLRTPLAGGLAQAYFLSVFLCSCGSLIDSGTLADRAYEKTARAMPFIPLRQLLSRSILDISQGSPLAKALSHKRIPAYISSLISAGEASGTLGASMVRAASIIDRDIEHLLKRLTALVEPVMMAGMGCAVGAIAFSIMMPIYDISKALQH